MPDGHTIAMALRAAYLALHRHSDAAFASGGATADQFVVLAALAEADSLTQQHLVERTCSDPNTLRAMLVLLERRGLIQRSPNPHDRRARCVTLTVEGRRVYERLWALGEPLRARLVESLGAEEARTLREQYREELESVRQEREALRHAAEEARQAAEEARHATIAAVAATADALSANLAQMQFLEDARNTLRQLKPTKPGDVH